MLRKSGATPTCFFGCCPKINWVHEKPCGEGIADKEFDKLCGFALIVLSFKWLVPWYAFEVETVHVFFLSIPAYKSSIAFPVTYLIFDA